MAALRVSAWQWGRAGSCRSCDGKFARRNPVTQVPGLNLQPLAIRLHAASRILEIDWQDGLTSSWEHRLLRRKCRCAECLAQQQNGSVPVASSDVALMDITPYGQNAVQLTFSDGHSRGIFPFEYLRQLAEQDNGAMTHPTTAPAIS